MNNSRIIYYDNLKFILILLVIFGHVISISVNSSIGGGIYNFIFYFHMPLFVFISGFFTRINNRVKFYKGIFRLLEAYIVFQLIHLLPNFIRGDNFTFASIINPEYALWYLLCVVYWRIIFYVVKPSLESAKTLYISLILFVLAGFIPLSLEASFQRAFFFFPFFVMGYYSQKYDIIRAVSKMPFSICLFSIGILLSLSIISVAIDFPNYVNDRDLLFGIKYYSQFPYPIYLSIIFRIAYLINACVISVLFLRLIPQDYRCYSKYGKDTLFFYLYHSIFILLLRYFVYVFSLPTNFFFCIIYFSVILLILFIMNKIPFFSIMINPITNINKKFKKF